MQKKSIVIASLLVLICAAGAHAAPVNTAVIRGTVISVELDCLTCSPGPHGCYVSVSPGTDPVAAALPAPTMADPADCSELSEGDCIELAGEVGDYLLVSGFTLSRFQVAASSWSPLASFFCE